MAELLQAGDIDGAANIYANEQAWFMEKGGDVEVVAVLDSAAHQLTALKTPALKSAISSVEGVQWPVAHGSWGEVQAALVEGDAALTEIGSIALFKRPEYTPSEIGALKKVLNEKKALVHEHASVAFVAYPLGSGGCFFEAYPVKLDASGFIVENQTHWDAALAKASDAELLHLDARYGDFLSSENQKGLSEAYFKKVCPNVRTASMKTILDAYGEMAQAGMQLDEIPGIKVAFMEMTSSTLKDKGVIEFPVGVEVDLPFQVVNGDLKKGIESQQVNDADIVILFNLAATRTHRKVDTSNSIKSTFLAGYNKVNNPEWDVLQVELQQANMEIMTNSGGSVSTNTGNPYADLGAAFGNFARSLRLNAAKKKVEELKEKFRNTPRYLDEPFYEDYAFKRVEMEVAKTGSVQYYIIDKRKNVYFSDFFDVRSQEFFTVAYNLREADPNRETHLNTNVTESDVDAYETEAVTVKLSELASHYAQSQGKSKKLKSMAAIHQDVIKNRNLAVAKAKEEQYDFDRQRDKRFESVVVVNTSDGQGSGFYVTSDIVLTNYHVVEEQKFIELKKWDNTETFGKVIAKDVRLDLALIKVQDRGTPVKFFSGQTINIGDTVDAIGHPKGQQFTLTRGIISTIRKHSSIMGVQGKPVLYIQTDTPINQGNSGGPLFLKNLVVGVNDWGLRKDIAEGLNFSIHYSEVFGFLKDNNVEYLKGS